MRARVAKKVQRLGPMTWRYRRSTYQRAENKVYGRLLRGRFCRWTRGLRYGKWDPVRATPPAEQERIKARQRGALFAKRLPKTPPWELPF